MPKRLLPANPLLEQANRLSQTLEGPHPQALPSTYRELFQKHFSQAQLAKPERSGDIAQYQIALLRAWLEQKTEKPPTKLKAKIQYLLLLLAGTLYFGCEGFDGITALLGIFSLPAILLLAAGLFFSVLSVIVFYSFDRVEIANNLGIASTPAPQLVNFCLEELTLMKQARHRIMKGWQTAEPEALAEYHQLLRMLLARYETLLTIQAQLQQRTSNPLLCATNYAVSVAAGILFFSGGFFAGQTVALKAAAIILGAAATPTLLPVLAFSLLIGVAAFAIYWFVERPGIEVFVSRWFKRDKEAIDRFCGKDLQDKYERSKALCQAVEERLADRTAPTRHRERFFLPPVNTDTTSPTELTPRNAADHHPTVFRPRPRRYSV